MMVSAIQESESAISIHVPLRFGPSSYAPRLPTL